MLLAEKEEGGGGCVCVSDTPYAPPGPSLDIFLWMGEHACYIHVYKFPLA